MKELEHPLRPFRFCPVCGQEGFAVKNPKAKHCRRCGFVFYSNPSSAVACFIRDTSGNYLVGTRNAEPARGTWDLVGGFVDNGESAEDALRREVAEETGLVLRTARYLFSLPNIYPYSGMDIRTVDMFYEATVDDITGAQAADDVAQLLTVSPAEMNPGKFGLDSVRRAVEKYIGNIK